MKFVHGVMIGTLITAGAMMYCSEGIDDKKKKMVKKGKQIAKRVGIYL